MEMLCCGCFASSSSALVHCAENKSIQQWRVHFDQKQKAGAWLIPGHIFWLFHPWMIHQTCVTRKNIVFNHGHNPRSVPKRDLSLNRMVTVASQHVGEAENRAVLPRSCNFCHPISLISASNWGKKPNPVVVVVFFFPHIHTRWLDTACCCSHFHSHVGVWYFDICRLKEPGYPVHPLSQYQWSPQEWETTISQGHC